MINIIIYILYTVMQCISTIPLHICFLPNIFIIKPPEHIIGGYCIKGFPHENQAVVLQAAQLQAPPVAQLGPEAASSFPRCGALERGTTVWTLLGHYWSFRIKTKFKTQWMSRAAPDSTCFFSSAKPSAKVQVVLFPTSKLIKDVDENVDPLRSLKPQAPR